ncbi:M23 family metallopeptidase [Parabacteroides distasonis]|uniref:M23 family metallopeptidase n=1 Tax=Parabacteroides distasonis TaxID=823 RepID=UPI003F99858E
MRKFLLMVISGISLWQIPARAQFNTVTGIGSSQVIEGAAGTTSGTENPKQGVVEDTVASGADADTYRKVCINRYMSVCYPLREIKITSPYGYRKDPFTGKRKFHGGMDLHARGDKVLAMMEGVVVKVGQDKTSGKYVTLQHGNFMVSYCHLSKILVARGTTVRPRDAVGITGSTGRSTGEHLHITCRLNGKSVDPAILFDYIGKVQQECVSALAEL